MSLPFARPYCAVPAAWTGWGGHRELFRGALLLQPSRRNCQILAREAKREQAVSSPSDAT